MGSVTIACVDGPPLNNVVLSIILVQDSAIIFWFISIWLVRPVNRIGRVKTRGTLVYIRMYRAYVRAL